MWGKGTNKKAAKIDTLIGQQTELKGDVKFSGGLHVDGIIRGNVIAEDESGSVLSLSERGRIEGEVRVPNVVLNGEVIGDVHALEHVEMAPNARVKGNVYYTVIEMARGAEINGSLVHRIREERKALPAGKKEKRLMPPASDDPVTADS